MTSRRDSRTTTERSDMRQLSQTQLEALSSIEAHLADDSPRGTEREEQHITLHDHSRSEQSPTALKRPLSSTNAGDKSYFESDTGSEDDEPIMSRAKSVRVVQPSIVHHSPSKASRVSRLSSTRSSIQERPISPLSGHISEASENSTSEGEAERPDETSRRPSDPPDATFTNEPATNPKATTHTTQAERKLTLLEGLQMNPLTEKDMINIHRAISAPARARTNASNRRVRIRPSDIIVEHLRDSTRPFREIVVTTPYPTEDDEDKSSTDDETDLRKDSQARPDGNDAATIKHIRDDRFPSIDQAEVLFLELALAHHPGVTTKLEVRVADKGAFDDEMLFNQIRKAYRNHLLGTPRFLFSCVRSVAYATVSTNAQHDFRTADFIRHFQKPRYGRRRRSWVIWLRRHSQQQICVNMDKSVAQPPLSASSHTTDKRPSVQSDATSTFGFPFTPPMLISRLPFFNKETTARPTASMAILSTKSDLENDRRVVEVKLSHGFSFWSLTLLLFGTVFLSTIATVMWVLFGVPGTRPGNNSEIAAWAAVTNARSSWQTAAQERVLTGLVLGLLIAILGFMIDISLIAGAYIFL